MLLLNRISDPMFWTIFPFMMTGILAGFFWLVRVYGTTRQDTQPLVNLVNELHGHDPEVVSAVKAKTTTTYNVTFKNSVGQTFVGECLIDPKSKRLIWINTPGHLRSPNRVDHTIPSSKEVIIDQLVEENQMLRDKLRTIPS